MLTDQTAVERLRAATASVHQALDTTLSIVDRLAASGGAAAMAPRYYALHASAEAAIMPHLGMDLRTRTRIPAIAAGLAALGLAPGRPLAASWSPFVQARPGNLAAAGDGAVALGALYVLEGSSLGGRMILRALRGRGVSTIGLEFLDPYGEQTGAQWRSLLGVLERELATEPARAAACGGACATFAFARACLANDVTRQTAA